MSKTVKAKTISKRAPKEPAMPALMFSAFTQGGATRMAKCYQKAGWTILTQPSLNIKTTLWEWNMINSKKGESI